MHGLVQVQDACPRKWRRLKCRSAKAGEQSPISVPVPAARPGARPDDCEQGPDPFLYIDKHRLRPIFDRMQLAAPAMFMSGCG